MELNKEAALKLWNERYGKQTQTKKDFAGRTMSKGLFGRTDSKSGWTLDHRQPKSLGGTNKKCNIEIVNHVTNTEKADKTTFEANGKMFQVQKDKESGSGCYKIVRLDTQTKNQSTKKHN